MGLLIAVPLALVGLLFMFMYASCAPLPIVIMLLLVGLSADTKGDDA